MDAVIVFWSKMVAQLGLGDDTDPVVGPASPHPPHVQAAAISLRLSLNTRRCPLACGNFAMCLNRHIMDGPTAANLTRNTQQEAVGLGAIPANAFHAGGAAEAGLRFAGVNPDGSSSTSSSAAAPCCLKDRDVARINRGESIEFGPSHEASIFGGVYCNEGCAATTGGSAPRGVFADFDDAGVLGVTNTGPDSNASRYFLSLGPLPRSMSANHPIIGRVYPSQAYGSGMARLLALTNHPQFKINAKTGIPANALTIIDCFTASTGPVPEVVQLPRRMSGLGKTRPRDDDDDAAAEIDAFRSGLCDEPDTTFDARIRTTKKLRAEAVVPSTGTIGASQAASADVTGAGARTATLARVAVVTQQRFTHDNGGSLRDLPQKIFTASVSDADLSADAARPVGVKANDTVIGKSGGFDPTVDGSSPFNIFEANALTYTSDLAEVMAQQADRHHSRQKRQGKTLGAAAKMRGISKAELLARSGMQKKHQPFAAAAGGGGKQHSVKHFQDRAKAQQQQQQKKAGSSKRRY